MFDPEKAIKELEDKAKITADSQLDEWRQVERKIEDILIELAKVTYQDVPVFRPQSMANINKAVEGEIFKLIEDS